MASLAQREERAAQAVEKAILAGHVLKANGADAGAYTAGPYTKAVGPSTYVLFGYGVRVLDGYRHREGDALTVGRLFVSCVGVQTAESAAANALHVPPAPREMPYRHRSALEEHIRQGCRRIRCPVCG